jgi:DNA-binding CsgD family transcriptional regulator/tetratricopeptide (TPR) repeat protein
MIGLVVLRVSSPVFVGRDAEAAQLWAAFERARTGSPAAVAVAGEAGVGKTRLVNELLGRVRAQHAFALTGGCLDVGEGVVAYAPLIEALRSLGGAVDPAELERVLGGARAELARLVPELGAPAETGVQAGPGAGALVPGRLFELVLGVLHRLAERGPLLLVVEDLHWADRSTRELLGFLVRNLRAGVALVLTYRSDELHRRHPLRPFLGELDRGGRVERLELGRLGRRELGDLLAGILGEPAPAALVGEILARSEGNPFFAEELLAARVEGAGGSAELLPEELRDLLLARVEALPQATQRLLQVAAVAGGQVDHYLLAEVAAQPPERLVELLREAVAHHVLVVEDSSGGYAFRHALVQEAIYDDLLPVQRPPLHTAYARALAARIEGEPAAAVGELGRLAYHWYAAHDLGRALLASVQAGQAAEAAFALAEAADHYERALELWQQAPQAAASSPLDRGALLQRAAQAASLAGEGPRAVALIAQALAETDAAADPLQAGALLERLARYQWFAGDTLAAMTTVEQAVATIPAKPPSAERARALAAHGQMLMLWSRNGAAQARCEEAVAVARQVGARAVEGHGLNSLGSSFGNRGHLETGVAHLDQARAIAAELGDPDDLCRAHHNLGCIYLIAGSHEEAVRAQRECLDLARRFGSMGSYGPVAIANAAQALLWLGRWEEAERLLDEAFDLDLDPRGMVNPLLSRGLQRLWRGDLDGARTDLTWVLERSKTSLDPQDGVPARAWLATGATWQGRPEDARAAVADGLGSLAEVDQPDLVAELCLAGLAAEAALAGRAAAHRDGKAHDQTARIAAGLLERARAAAGADGVAVVGAVRAKLLTVEAEWTRVTGRGDPDHWAETAGAWDELGCPWPAAYARWRLAEALLEHGATREEAAVPLRRAWATARGLGARPLQAGAESLARRSRIALVSDPVAAGETESAEAQPAVPGQELGLTPREREVLALVAEGRTNRQIAEALFITEKTASVHVSNILAKLGVANRAEAAATVHRLGLTG